MSKKEIINIAIIGLGTNGKRHVMAIEKMDDIKVCGVVVPGGASCHTCGGTGTYHNTQ